MKKLIKKFYSTIKNIRLRYDKLFIFKVNLIENKKLDSSYNIERAKVIDDIKQIIQERGNGFVRKYKEWLNSGFICFVAKLENDTVGIVWLNNIGNVPLEFGYKQKLKDNTEAGLIDAYVLKEKRGKGIYKTIWNESLLEAQRLGIKTLYAYILNKNISSIKVHYKLGVKDVDKILYYIRILWFNLYFLKTFKSPINIAKFKRDINFQDL